MENFSFCSLCRRLSLCTTTTLVRPPPSRLMFPPLPLVEALTLTHHLLFLLHESHTRLIPTMDSMRRRAWISMVTRKIYPTSSQFLWMSMKLSRLYLAYTSTSSQNRRQNDTRIQWAYL